MEEPSKLGIDFIWNLVYNSNKLGQPKNERSYMNSNREDYLKVLYEEGGLEKPVSNKIISSRLDIAPGSVTEMLTKLSDAGLVEYIAYKGSKLTEKGLSICSNLIRSHRLWEVFLMRHLNYSWREAHEEAHRLEHVATNRMVDRLDKFLDYPEVCPHGESIPKKGEYLTVKHGIIPLSDFGEGESCMISKIVEDGDLLDYAQSIGLQIGEEIQIISKGAYEGPIEFNQGGKKITMSYKAATQIFVEKV